MNYFSLLKWVHHEIFFFLILGHGDTNSEEISENDILEWRIYPTAVKVPESLESSEVVEVTEEEILSRQVREPQGPVSRDELLTDLLKDQRNEIHVEDFLWTGSGTVTQF